jgi:CBS domain-containing protein
MDDSRASVDESTVQRAWSSGAFDGDTDRALTALESSMTVSLIATFDLLTCEFGDRLENVRARVDLQPFDHVPVREDGCIVGILNQREIPADAVLVRDAMTRLHESILISADASLLTFLEGADRHPCRLVLRGTRVEGIVTLSDIQKLAVRPVLFASVTQVELLLAHWIRVHATEAEWIAKLSEKRRDDVEDKWTKYNRADLAIDRLACTEFCDKRCIALKLGAFASRGAAERNLKLIEQVRNSVAHAGDYALTADTAREVARMVRAARSVIQELRKGVGVAQPA